MSSRGRFGSGSSEMRLLQCHSKPVRAVISYRICPVELQRTAVRHFAHILRDCVAGFRAESSPSSSTRAHTNTRTHARAHTYIWGEGMGTVGNLTGTVQFVVLKLIFKPNFLWGLNVARLLCCLHDLKRRSRFVLHQLRKILVAFVS